MARVAPPPGGRARAVWRDRTGGCVSILWLVALAGGVATFFSPCSWPLYPAYIGYLASASAGGAPERPGSPLERRMVLRQACGFVFGFGLAFVALGATASLVGGWLRAYEVPLRQVSGLLIVGFGALMTGLLPAWVLGREVRPGLPVPGGSPPAAAAVGLAFGFGWTPCVGPALASILLLAGTVGHVARGTELLAVFAAGLGLPFLVVAACFDRLRPWMRRAAPALPWVRRSAGVLLVALGWLVFTGDLSGIAAALTSGTAL